MAQDSGHVRKRQYQHSIHSYFHRDADSKSAISRQVTAPSRVPQLPVETQASLLSVGMRVRKSVPEGYKTHKTIGVHISPILSTAPGADGTHTKRRHNDLRAKELTPFCGLHKIGGWAAQHAPSSSTPAVMQNDDEADDELPDLIMSQTTIPDSQSAFTSATQSSASRKRRYDEEIEDDLDAYFNDDQAMDSVTPIRVPVGRPMARTKQPLSHRSRRGGTVQVVGADDFDEATFLIPEDMDLDSI